MNMGRKIEFSLCYFTRSGPGPGRLLARPGKPGKGAGVGGSGGETSGEPDGGPGSGHGGSGSAKNAKEIKDGPARRRRTWLPVSLFCLTLLLALILHRCQEEPPPPASVLPPILPAWALP